MFHDATAWDWPDAPLRPIIGSRDLPKRPTRLSRFIPAEQLDRLMSAVRVLPDIHQRAALIIARWSGARRSEITRLEYNCLDTYPDGTSRLRIPAGKTGKERMAPLHPEAATAIRELQALDPPGRGFADERTGIEVRRLFSLKGKCISSQTLFEASLESACQTAGLVDDRGRATITAHRFRHTIGTELIEGGARVHTVMKMLGHTSIQETEASRLASGSALPASSKRTGRNLRKRAMSSRAALRCAVRTERFGPSVRETCWCSPVGGGANGTSWSGQESSMWFINFLHSKACEITDFEKHRAPAGTSWEVVSIPQPQWHQSRRGRARQS